MFHKNAQHSCARHRWTTTHTIGHGSEMMISRTYSREHATKVPSCDKWFQNNLRHFNRTTPTKEHHSSSLGPQERPTQIYRPYTSSSLSDGHNQAVLFYFIFTKKKLEKTLSYCVNIYVLPHEKKTPFSLDAEINIAKIGKKHF